MPWTMAEAACEYSVIDFQLKGSETRQTTASWLAMAA
jgi:hypothetical protein